MATPLTQLARSYRHTIPYVVLSGTLLLTAIATYYLEITARAKDQIRFDAAVQRAENNIQDRLETYIALLRAGSGLFNAVPEVDRAQFRAFTQNLSLRTQYPGIQGIGFSQRVSSAELDTLIASMRQQGHPKFAVQPDYRRREYNVIIYLEPLDRRNQAALGYDMFTEPVRRSAMERARDSGEPAASGRVTLVQEIDSQKQAGFLIYMPVYAGGRVPGSVAERRAALRGFIYSPFRADDFVRVSLTAQADPLIEVEIYDGPTLQPDSLLTQPNAAPPPTPQRQPYLTTTRAMNVAGQPWSLVFTSRPELEQTSERRLVPFIGLGGTLLAVILFGLTRSQTKARLAAEHAATNLIHSEQALRFSLEQVQQASDERAYLLERERQARTEAETANRIKDEFLAVLSHELRTPLNPILGWSSLLQSRDVSEETLAKALESIERNVQLQVQLVDDLLDVSRVLRGKLTLNKVPLNLSLPIRAAVETVQLLAQEKAITLRTELNPQVGLVLGDMGRLQQVMMNLLSNAIKFTPVGGAVTVCLDQVEDRVQVQVQDTGKGISADFLPHVFEHFRQQDSTTTRQFGGLGLGLAIVSYITEMHGGTVTAASPGAGQGATFTVQLPAIAPASPPARAYTPPTATPDVARLQGLRIVVVDDEADTLTFLTVLLEQLGASVTAVDSALDALQHIEQTPPDLLISDIGMPQMDGYTLIQKVRSNPPEAGGRLPAIALTAYASEADEQRAKAAGFQLHLAKPISTQALIAAILSLQPASD